METKKLNKILSICFVLILIGVAFVSATFAANADGITINEDGIVTVESPVVLVQEQRNADGFEPYDGRKMLHPVVGTLGTDNAGYPVNENFVDRFVTVQNNSETAVYTRVLVAMPAAFDTAVNGNKPINVVFGNSGDWEDPKMIAQNVMCGNTLSNIYSVEYLGLQGTNGILAASDRASGYAVYGVYIHQDVGNTDNHYTFAGQEIEYDISKGLDLKIMAQAVQTEGFDKREDAFGTLRVNPWDPNNGGINDIQ